MFYDYLLKRRTLQIIENIAKSSRLASIVWSNKYRKGSRINLRPITHFKFGDFKIVQSLKPDHELLDNSTLLLDGLPSLLRLVTSCARAALAS